MSSLPWHDAARGAVLLSSAKHVLHDDLRQIIGGRWAHRPAAVGAGGAVRALVQIRQHNHHLPLRWPIAHKALKSWQRAIVSQEPVNVKNPQPILQTRREMQPG